LAFLTRLIRKLSLQYRLSSIRLDIDKIIEESSQYIDK